MKKRVVVFISLLFITSLFISCIIKQEIYFNKDFSGTYKFTYNFTDYNNYMEENEDSSNVSFQNEDFISLIQQLMVEFKKVDGINDIKFLNDTDNGISYFMYEFQNINALNKGIQLIFENMSSEAPTADAPYFVKKRKNIYYVRPVMRSEDRDSEADKYESFFNQVFIWEFSIEFEREVKKHNVLKDTLVEISKDKRKFIEKGGIYDVYRTPKKWKFKLK